MISAGIGCRSGCSVDDLVGAVHAALALCGRHLAEIEVLYAPEFKHAEASLPLAAARLGKPLRLLDSAALAQHAGSVLTTSPTVLAAVGLPSVAETAALAGAAARDPSTPARLLASRAVCGFATCALAISRTEPS